MDGVSKMDKAHLPIPALVLGTSDCFLKESVDALHSVLLRFELLARFAHGTASTACCPSETGVRIHMDQRQRYKRLLYRS